MYANTLPTLLPPLYSTPTLHLSNPSIHLPLPLSFISPSQHHHCPLALSICSPKHPTPFPNKRTFVPSRPKLGLRSRWVCFGLLLPLPFFVAFGHATIRYYGPCLHTSPSPPLGWKGEVFSYEPLWQTQLLVLSVAAAFARLYGSRHLLKHVGAYGLHQVREVSLWRL